MQEAGGPTHTSFASVLRRRGYNDLPHSDDYIGKEGECVCVCTAAEWNRVPRERCNHSPRNELILSGSACMYKETCAR